MSRRELTRHETDLVSLVAGLVLLVVAVSVLLEDLTDLRVRGDVVAPVVLLTVGLGGLVLLLRGRRAPDEDDAGTDPRTSEDEAPETADLT